MIKLSTGDDSTCWNWLRLCETVFGPESPQAAYWHSKIDEQWPDEEVLADERQMLFLMMSLLQGGRVSAS